MTGHRYEGPEEPDALGATLDTLGDRWSLWVIQEIFEGRDTFEAIRERLGISRSVLSQRLRWLIDVGVIEPEPYGTRAGRESNRYLLTPAGVDLFPTVQALRDWGLEHVVGDGRATVFYCAECGGPVKTGLACAAGHVVWSYLDVERSDPLARRASAGRRRDKRNGEQTRAEARLEAIAHTSILELATTYHSTTPPKPAEGPGLSTLLVAWGWWSRIVRSAEAVVLLYDNHLAHEAAPIVRTIVHHTVALRWLITRPAEVLAALTWEHQREGSKVLAKVLERGRDLEPNTGPTPPDAKPPPGVKFLRDAEKLCERTGEPNAYPAFLFESKFLHPTGISADAYLELGLEGPVLLKDAGVATDLSGTALFATSATVDFSTLAGLDELAAKATEIQDSLEAALKERQRPPKRS